MANPFASFKAPKRRGAAKFDMGGGASQNAGVGTLLGFMLGQQQQQQQRQQVGQTTADINRQFPGGVTPGSTVNIAGVRTQLNPKLTEAETFDLSVAKAVGPSIQRIYQMLDTGVLDSPIPGIGRTAKQAAVDAGEPITTSLSPALQQFQGELNQLKSILPFTRGGKQLTGTEKAVVFRLLNVTGKSNDQIKRDINSAQAILEEKERLILGGAQAARAEVQPTTGVADADDDPLGVFR